jgi:hypothetical protein
MSASRKLTRQTQRRQGPSALERAQGQWTTLRWRNYCPSVTMPAGLLEESAAMQYYWLLCRQWRRNGLGRDEELQ